VSVLEVRDLTVEFGQRGGGKLRAVDNLSFELHEGQTLALVGESGSGKSTVVRALGQLVKRNSGKILLAFSWSSKTPSPHLTPYTPCATTWSGRCCCSEGTREARPWSRPSTHYSAR
jgi:ABC-type phosphate/phosphonate transport system ATPase subunit